MTALPTDAHECDVNCFYWPWQCPNRREPSMTDTTCERHPPRLPLTLANALDIVAAAYRDGMRRAGMLPGKLAEVDAYAQEQVRSVYTDAESGPPTYTVVVGKHAVHLAGLTAVTQASTTCAAMSRNLTVCEPIGDYGDLGQAVAAMEAAAEDQGLDLCGHCLRAVRRQPD
jgi:hypothetical protein